MTPADGKNENEAGSLPGKDCGSRGVIVAVIIIVLCIVGGVVAYLVYKKEGNGYDPVKVKVEMTKEAEEDAEAGKENSPSQATQEDPINRKLEQDLKVF